MMRAAISCLLIFGLLLTGFGVCGTLDIAAAGDATTRGKQVSREANVSSYQGGSDTSSVEMTTDEGFWHWIVRIVVRAIRDGVIYDTVKVIVKRIWERPPSPATSAGWTETGCGMGAAGGSRY